MIFKVEKYFYNKMEFSSLDKVTKYIESEIGKIIDSTPNRLNPKDAFAVFDIIIKNRNELCKLLSGYNDAKNGIVEEA